MYFVEVLKCKGIILLKSCCVELLDERVYFQYVVFVIVISFVYIKGNSILGKMFILWEIYGKKKLKKKNECQILLEIDLLKFRLKLNCEFGNLSWFGKRFFFYLD